MNNDKAIYDYNTAVIKSIDFSIVTNNEVLKMSALDQSKNGITVHELYDHGEPYENGLLDKRMGISDWSYTCTTCHYRMQYCNGHFGHIVLANVLFNMQLLDLVGLILNIYCCHCSTLLWNKKYCELTELIKTKKNGDRIRFLKDLLKNVRHCHNCNSPVGKAKIVKKLGIIEIVIEKVFNGKLFIEKKNAKQVFNILKNIRNNEASILGISCHPKDLMYENFIVPPVTIRPSIKGDFTDASSQEDQLTMRITKIVKANKNTLIHKEKEKENDSLIKYSNDHINLLQLEVATYINNESLKMPKTVLKNNAPLKSLVTRFKGGKKGRIRGNLMGKRVNHYGRTVISPDPLLKINEVYVPVTIAKNLTYPEIVTTHNIKRLTLNVQNGMNIYPGANSLTTFKNGSYKTILLNNKLVELKLGDEVNRHLINGDVILINRQPTLHKYGILAHYVKVKDDENLNTLRINPSVCKGYGADFDGDEMNIFTSQSILTEIELENITDVKYNIISAKNSLPIVGAVYDTVIGIYYLTKFKEIYNNEDLIDLLVSTDLPNFKKFDKNKKYMGTEFFDLIMPENINLTNKSVIIKNSKIVSGYIDGYVIKEGQPNTLIQEIWNLYNPDMTQSIIDNMTKIAINFNIFNGFTISINDYIINKEIQENIKQLFKTEKLKALCKITESENNVNDLNHEEVETYIKDILNGISTKLSTYIVKNLSDDNNNIIMLNSKSKGKSENIVKMLGCAGQQNFDGKRMLKIYNNRTLPYFHQNDDSPFARGFIESSFTKGMNVEELLMSTSTSRNSLITQAIKTADTGYVQRKLVKSAEDFLIKYDYYVRNSSESVLQFVYGDSGIDTTKQYKYEFELINKNNKTIEQEYKFDTTELKNIKFTTNENNEYYKLIINIRDNLRTIKHKASLNYYLTSITESKKPKNEIKFLSPVNIDRLIIIASEQKHDEPIVEPKYILDKINYILKMEVTKILTFNKENENNKFKIDDDALCKTIFKYVLYDSLSLKKCILKYKFTKKHIDYIADEIIKTYNRAMIEPGDMVGVLAALTLGEPATQMTISDFHSAGVSKSGITGVPRLKEIYTPSPNIKNPMTIIYFDKKHNKNLDYLNKISLNLINISINDIKHSISIYYDNNTDFETNTEMKIDDIKEKSIYKNSNSNKNSCLNHINNLDWVIRIEFDKEKLLMNEIKLKDIVTIIAYEWENRLKDKKQNKQKIILKILFNKILQLAILSNDDNNNKPVIHIRFNIIDYNMEVMEEFIKTFIQEIQIKGTNDIKSLLDKGPLKINSLSYDENNDTVDDFEYIIRTEGINMHEIIKFKGIDINKIYINDIIKVVEIYGIEAGRTIIINELIDTYLNKDENINYTHYTIFADIMTSFGKLMSLDRFGMAKMKTNPLSKASFEQPVEILVNAGIYGQTDDMKSVSSRVIGGLCFLGGSNLVDVILDKEFIENSEYVYNTDQYDSQKNANIITNNLTNEIDDNVFIPSF